MMVMNNRKSQWQIRMKRLDNNRSGEYFGLSFGVTRFGGAVVVRMTSKLEDL